jgi:hypothetical protein
MRLFFVIKFASYPGSSFLNVALFTILTDPKDALGRDDQHAALISFISHQVIALEFFLDRVRILHASFF